MSATYRVEVVSRGSGELALRCSITHPDVEALPLPGHHPTWARLLLLADSNREWETLRREDIWSLSDRIARVELLALREHPRIRDVDHPSITVRLVLTGDVPSVPDVWEPWLTIGDAAAAQWDPTSEPKQCPRLVEYGEAVGSPEAVLGALAVLREHTRNGSGSAVHNIAQGLCHGVVPSEAVEVATRSVLDGLHLTGTRSSSLALLAHPLPEVVATYVVAAGQSSSSVGLLAVAALGPEAMPHAGPVLARLAEGRSLPQPAKNRVLREDARSSEYELLARRCCLGDATPLGVRALATLGERIAYTLPMSASITSTWSTAERAAFERAVANVHVKLAKSREQAALLATRSAKKKAPSKKQPKKAGKE